ncbi:MAG: VOC family protein [Gammaproteobacteria bacterium]|nr:MAG: VOC family protein [Gammaproteobacteria bacterium]
MNYHKGRLIDHIHLRVKDLETSKRFYLAVLDALGLMEGYGEGDGYFYADEIYVDVADDKISHVHLAFQARDKDTVHKFYEAAISAGAQDNGKPGPRNYHAGYYGAFVFDPDGNNIEAVWHGPAKRSAESILIERV